MSRFVVSQLEGCTSSVFLFMEAVLLVRIVCLLLGVGLDGRDLHF